MRPYDHAESRSYDAHPLATMSSNPDMVSGQGPEPGARPVGWPAAVLAYLAIALLVTCFRLGSIDVITMEGIVADGARHMERTGEYAVPRLHGEIYSYKPPLTYWMALASFRAFGEETEWTLRLPFALSGLFMGLGVLWITGRVLGPRTGLLCALASLTGGLAVQKIHLAEFDMPVAAGVGLAVASACRNFATARPSVAVWLIGYLGLAAAFLAKGVPALMFYGPGLLAAAVFARRLRDLFRPPHLAGVLAFLLPVAGWIASAYAAEGWAAFEQPLAEGGEKAFVWTLAGFGSTLAKPLVAWALFLPWTLLLPFPARPGKSEETPARRMAITAGAFAAAGVVVFMLVPATESRYLLPLAVPVGIFCGIGAEQALAFGVGRIRRRGIEVLVSLVGLYALIVSLGGSEGVPAGRVLLGVSAVATIGLVTFGLRRDSRPQAVRLVVSAALLFWMAHVFVLEPRRASSRSLRSVAAAFDRHLAPGESVWTGPVSKHWRQSSLFFYLRRPVQTIPAGGLAVGDHLVLVEDEHGDLMQRLAGSYKVLERGFHGDCELILGRVEAEQPPG